jgi:hypothetical protein
MNGFKESMMLWGGVAMVALIVAVVFVVINVVLAIWHTFR